MTKISPLNPRNFGLVQHKQQGFVAYVPPGTDPEQLKEPAFWASIGPQVRMGDSIRVISEDYAYVIDLFVTFAQGNQIRCKILNSYELDDVQTEELGFMGDFTVKLRGPRKWCIVQLSTGNVVKENIPTQQEAIRELAEYQQALGK